MLAGIKATNNGEGYKNYLNSAIKYMATSLVAEIKKLHPDIDVSKIDYNDPQWKPIIAKLPYKATVIGSLATSLGLDDKLMTEALWEDIFSGWLPVDVLPPSSHLRAYAKETPKGMMIQLSNNPGKFDKDNNYIFDGQRRPTNEALFTLGKGLSIWLVAKEIEEPGALNMVQEMHNEVMREFILPEMEKHARIRTREEDELTEMNAYELAVVSIMHIETRSLQPHIHFHDQILNTAMSKDGRLYALHTDTIYEHKANYDAIYMSRMKEKMESRFKIEFDAVLLKKDEENEFLSEEEKCVASFDISKKIVPDSMIDYYSDRIKEIEKSLKEKGIANTANAREVEQKSTRDDKSELSPSELMAMWKVQFEELGYSAKHLTEREQKKTNYIEISDRRVSEMFLRRDHNQKLERKIGGMTLARERLFTDNNIDGEILSSLLHRKEKKKKPKFESAFFDDGALTSFANKTGVVEFKIQQFKAHVVKQALKSCRADVAWEIADRIANEQCVIHIPKERYDYFQPYFDGLVTDPKQIKKMGMEFEREARFITKDMLKMDEYISKTCTARSNEAQWIVSLDIVYEEIRKYEKEKGFLISPDQAEDVKAAFTEKGSVVCTDGKAGTGKSTAAEIKVRIMERMGFNVWGTSIANTATKGLAASAGMKLGQYENVTKLLKLLDEGKIVWNEKTILVFDEAGMASLDQLYKIIKHANNAGAKINFIGEAVQLQPIGAANGFKYLKENFVSRPLTTINRQKSERMKANVNLWQQGHAEAATKDLYESGHVLLPKTNKDAFELVAKLYVENERPETEKIIMSALNSDNDQINNLIKELLQKTGKLDAQAEQIKVMCSDGVEREYGEGDRIAFFKNTKADDGIKRQIDNSDTGKIKSLRRNHQGNVTVVVLEMDTLDKDGNKEVRYVDISKRRAQFRHGWSGTIHKAQGASKSSAYQVVSHADHNAFNQYVAASRHKFDYTLIMSEEFKDASIKKLRNMPMNEKQNEKLEWLRKDKNIDIPDYAYENYGNAKGVLDKYIDVQMPGADNTTHVLDDYADIIKAFSAQKFKKNVSDFVHITDGAKMLRDLERERIADMEMFRETRDTIKALKKVETPYKLKLRMDVGHAKDIKVPTRKEVAVKKHVEVKVKKEKKKQLAM